MTDPAADPRPLVLVAEDEPIASMALRAQLEALDYRVLGPARNGGEAVALGACYPADMALFDVRMPERSGLDAARDLFEIAPIPVILLTGVGSADLPDPLPRPPIFGLLAKPIDLATLATGFSNARDAFDRWIDDDSDRAAALRDSREQRNTLGRAVAAMAGSERSAPAAQRLLQRAEEEGRSSLDIAREILARPQP